MPKIVLATDKQDPVHRGFDVIKSELPKGFRSHKRYNADSAGSYAGMEIWKTWGPISFKHVASISSEWSRIYWHDGYVPRWIIQLAVGLGSVGIKKVTIVNQR